MDNILNAKAVFFWHAIFEDTSYPSGVINFCIAKGAIPKGMSTYLPKIEVFNETFVISLKILG